MDNSSSDASTRFFPKQVVIAHLSALSETGKGIQLPLPSAGKGKSRTAALNKELHKPQNERRPSHLGKAVFPCQHLLGCSLFVCFLGSYTACLDDSLLQHLVVLTLVFLCAAALPLHVWGLCKVAGLHPSLGHQGHQETV